MPSSLKELGISEILFTERLSLLASYAFEDQTTTANPRMPLISEIEDLLKKAYYGE